jgi:SHS2 domain-containing protein
MSWRRHEGVTVADAGFAAEADDLPGLLAAAVDATLSVMVGDPSRLVPRARREIRLAAPDAAGLLAALLEEVIWRKDAEGLFLRLVEAAVGEGAGGLRLEGTLTGEPLDRGRHEPGTDVKALTLQGLEVSPAGGRWAARFVLDV